jgi:hypothetical protein
VLFARTTELAGRRQAGVPVATPHQRDILERIRRFFAIEA